MEGIERLKTYFAQQADNTFRGVRILSRSEYSHFIAQLSTCEDWPERFISHSYLLYLSRQKSSGVKGLWPRSELLGLIMFQHHCPGNANHAA
jgi:hypothetical protein